MALHDRDDGVGYTVLMPVQKWSDRIWVVQLGDDPGFTEDLDYLMEKALGSETLPDVVLDMSGIEHINSSNLSHLLRLRKLMVEGDARLRLAGPPDRVWALFLSTGLDKVFDFRTDTTTALADLQVQ